MTTPRSPKNDEYATVGFVNQLLQGIGLGDQTTLSTLIDQRVSQATSGLASNTALTMVAQTIPLLSNLVPSPESKSGAAGGLATVPRADHQHPRLTSSTPGQTDANGNSTVTFTRSFSSIPGVVLMAIENTNSAGPSMKVMKWLTKNAQGTLVDRSTAQGSTESYDGCVVYAWRGRALPTQTPISVASLLTGVITALNNLLTSLSGYEAYVPAGNVSFTCIAVQNSST